MTDKQALNLLETWLDHYNDVDKVFDELNDLIGGMPDSKLQNPVWQMFQGYTGVVSHLIGDRGEWLYWYLYDNEQGKREMEAEVNGKVRKIKTLKDLLRVIKGEVKG
jgi:hypothetical protein